MNYLFHLFLSGDDPEVLTGNFMGDYVKGPLDTRHPPRLRSGIELHRRIDSFARDQVDFNRSRRSLDPRFGLYRGIMVDLFYDHFLAAGWHRWSAEPLDEYLRRTRRVLEARSRHIPERLREFLPILFEDLLPSYREPEGIARALARMGRRLRSGNPLAEGGAELNRHYRELEEDFLAFLPAAQEFTRKFRETGGTGSEVTGNDPLRQVHR